MGILRYVVQGFGWEVGRHAAREGIEAIEAQADEPAPPPPSPREQKRLEAAQQKAAVKEAARKKAEIEAELARLKKQK